MDLMMKNLYEEVNACLETQVKHGVRKLN